MSSRLFGGYYQGSALGSDQLPTRSKDNYFINTDRLPTLMRMRSAHEILVFHMESYWDTGTKMFQPLEKYSVPSSYSALWPVRKWRQAIHISSALRPLTSFLRSCCILSEKYTKSSFSLTFRLILILFVLRRLTIRRIMILWWHRS